MARLKQCLIIALFVCYTSAVEEEPTKFPPGFMIGTATSAYQIEGAINEGGRGVSIWDTFVNKSPSLVKDNSTGEIAADSYHKYKKDVQLLKNIGFDHYRFSISWVRILPRGEIDDINQEGIDYYNKLIDELIVNNIVPVVTIYHWDLPQALQDLGGWLNPVIADYFEDFALTLFKTFGDRVKWWITINEPTIINRGYCSNLLAPGLIINGSGEYLVGHNLLRAHAKAYRLYEKEFKETQKGKVGISLSAHYYIPLNNTEDDKLATDRAFQFDIGWFAHPIFTKEGGYPPLMKEIIDKNSLLENRTRSRLPAFTAEEINSLRGSSDFLGLNHYSSDVVSAKTKLTGTETYSQRDIMFNLQADPSWTTSKENTRFNIVPTGLRGILNFIKDNYDNPPVFILENGYGDDGRCYDYERIFYLDGYLSNVLKAIHIDKCNVTGYTIWSLLDNLEWSSGYTLKFGLVHVDFDSPERIRKPKLSANYVKEILETRQMPNLYTTIAKSKIDPAIF